MSSVRGLPSRPHEDTPCWGQAKGGGARRAVPRSEGREPGARPTSGLRSSPMRVVDLDRDMSDVIPTGMSLDSEYLFERMTEVTLAEALPRPGRRVLDVASGVGQDSDHPP